MFRTSRDLSEKELSLLPAKFNRFLTQTFDGKIKFPELRGAVLASFTIFERALDAYKKTKQEHPASESPHVSILVKQSFNYLKSLLASPVFLNSMYPDLLIAKYARHLTAIGVNLNGPSKKITESCLTWDEISDVELVHKAINISLGRQKMGSLNFPELNGYIFAAASAFEKQLFAYLQTKREHPNDKSLQHLAFLVAQTGDELKYLLNNNINISRCDSTATAIDTINTHLGLGTVISGVYHANADALEADSSSSDSESTFEELASAVHRLTVKNAPVQVPHITIEDCSMFAGNQPLTITTVLQPCHPHIIK